MKEFYQYMRWRNRPRIGWMILLVFSALIVAGDGGLRMLVLCAIAAAVIHAQDYINVSEPGDGKSRKSKRENDRGYKKSRFANEGSARASWLLGPDLTLGGIMQAHSFAPGKYFLTLYLGTLPGLALAAAVSAVGGYVTGRAPWYIATSVILILVIPFLVFQLFRLSVGYSMRHDRASLAIVKILSYAGARLLALGMAMSFAFAIPDLAQPIRFAMYGIRKGEKAVAWSKVESYFFMAVIMSIALIWILVKGVKVWSLVVLLFCMVYTIGSATEFACITEDRVIVRNYAGIEGTASYVLPDDITECRVYCSTSRNKSEKTERREISFSLYMRDGKVLGFAESSAGSGYSIILLRTGKRQEATESWDSKYHSIWNYTADLVDRFAELGIPCTFTEIDESEDRRYGGRELTSEEIEAMEHIKSVAGE